jgi:hypothetical protein
MTDTLRVSPTSDPQVIEVRLSEAQIESEFSADVIADVNSAGNWIRGLELLRSGAQFSLELALASFERRAYSPQHRGSRQDFSISYDESADAGFLYLPYASPDSIEHELKSDPGFLRVSYSVEDDNAAFGLTTSGALAYLRFRIPVKEKLETFIRLFQTRGSS